MAKLRTPDTIIILVLINLAFIDARSIVSITVDSNRDDAGSVDDGIGHADNIDAADVVGIPHQPLSLVRRALDSEATANLLLNSDLTRKAVEKFGSTGVLPHETSRDESFTQMISVRKPRDTKVPPHGPSPDPPPTSIASVGRPRDTKVPPHNQASPDLPVVSAEKPCNKRSCGVTPGRPVMPRIRGFPPAYGSSLDLPAIPDNV